VTDTTAAEAYERFLVPNIFAPWAQLTLETARLAPGQRVLDVACGTGIAARLAAVAVGRSGRVTAVDIDAGMLAVAGCVAVTDCAAPIDWQRADATALPFPDASFDAVLCFEGIQFFADRAKGVAELRRMLRRDGRIVGTIWGPLAENPGYRALSEGLGRFVSPDAARLPPFQLDDPDAVRALLAQAGFDRIVVEPRRIVRAVPSIGAFVDWVAAGAPTTRHKLALLNDENRAAFLRFVEGRLERHQRGAIVEMPYMRHLFSAHAA
jgi:SAM-dependent methyltransferase